MSVLQRIRILSQACARRTGRRTGATAWLVALMLAWIPMAHAQAPQPPEIAARAWLLLDATSGQVLAAKDQIGRAHV